MPEAKALCSYKLTSPESQWRLGKDDDGRKIASLTMSVVSSTFWAHCRIRSKKSAISLSLKNNCHCQPRLAR